MSGVPVTTTPKRGMSGGRLVLLVAASSILLGSVGATVWAINSSRNNKTASNDTKSNLPVDNDTEQTRHRRRFQADAPGANPAAPAAPAPNVDPVSPSRPGSLDDDKVITEVSDWKKSVVLINTKFAGGEGIGTGFFVGKDLIATAAHVVADERGGGGGRNVTVFLQKDGSSTPGKALKSVMCLIEDKEKDLAILRVPGAGGIPLAVSTVDHLPETTPVIAIGHPKAEELWSVTRGFVTGYINKDGQDFYGTDARIEQGNSGGPVMTTGGQVIGIADFKLAGVGSMNYAVPVSRLRPLIEQAQGMQSGDECGSASRGGSERSNGPGRGRRNGRGQGRGRRRQQQQDPSDDFFGSPDQGGNGYSDRSEFDDF